MELHYLPQLCAVTFIKGSCTRVIYGPYGGFLCGRFVAQVYTREVHPEGMDPYGSVLHWVLGLGFRVQGSGFRV